MHTEQRQTDLSPTEDELTHDKQQHLGTHCVHITAVGSSIAGGDTVQRSAAVWSALEEAYCGSEDELQMAALQADTCEALATEYSSQGRTGVAQPSGSIETNTSFISEGGADSSIFAMEQEQVCSSLWKARDAEKCLSAQ